MFSDVLVVIPAFNEAPRLPGVLAAVFDLEEGIRAAVVDDGSHDETARVAMDHGAIVLRHPFNLGYGAALQTGYKHALREAIPFVVQMDADGQHDARQIPSLLEPVLRGETDLVVGSRFLEHTGYHMGLTRSVGSWLFGQLASLVGLKITDPTSGFQALNRAVLEVYARDSFPTDYPDVDVLLVAHRHGIRIQERSVEMNQETRPSTLHGGLLAWYYVYRMVLSLWAGSRHEKSLESDGRD